MRIEATEINKREKIIFSVSQNLRRRHRLDEWSF